MSTRLRRWDVVFLRAEDDPTLPGHPAVVLSPDDFLDDPRHPRLNVLLGSKKIPAERAKAHHFILDEAEGLDHLTLLDCSFVYVARKAAVLRPAGTVSPERRDGIRRRLRAALGLG